MASFSMLSFSQLNAKPARKSQTAKQITTPPAETAAAATGVTKKEEGNLGIFIVAVIFNGVMMLMCIHFFLFGRSLYPDVYEWKLIRGLSPSVLVGERDWLNWAKRSLKVTINQVQDSAGLDQAMLLEFTHLGMKIMAVVGIPMICIMGPLNCAFGGNAAGEDHLSYLSFGNVEDGSWLYWIHCFVVWGVVFCVQVFVYNAMKLFMVHRKRWLEELPEIQANTIMVEEIPEDKQSDAALKAYFELIFGARKVKSATVVKICPELTVMCDKKKALTLAMDKAKFQESKGETPATSVRDIASEIATVTTEITAERAKILAEAAIPGKITSATGFVTFYSRHDAEIAAVCHYSPDVAEWVVSTPPPAQAMSWENLQTGSQTKIGFQLLGYGLVAALYMGYLPLVIWITQIANEINMGPLQPLWGAFAPTLGLQFMVAFLPTFLILIFQLCFSLTDSTEAQARLQNWYFIFQVVFVLLVTAIGPSLWDIMQTLAKSPFEIFDILGKTMPHATHFYMNFLVLQWTAHFTNFTRSVNLMKYWLFVKMYEPAQAKALSEPEDQDYYGIGSRSARFTINLCIGIVFGTLSPPINFLTFVNFAICRLVYGYLVNFAETKKPDLGGVFWVQMLKHVFWGNIIYCILMTGVLLGRADSNGPGMISAASLFYVLWSFDRFKGLFSWERLTIYDLVTEKRNPKMVSGVDSTYEQPQFIDH